MKSFFNNPKLAIPVVLVVVAVAGFFIFRSVGKAPVVNIPTSNNVASGTIVTQSTANSVDLAFAASGRVANVDVNVGDRVTKGEVLATLDTSAASGTVTQARGALELAQAQYASLDVQYANAKQQQDVLVENAYRTMLSSGLAAIPSVQDDSHIPTISGTYTCDTNGSYVITPYSSEANSGYSFKYSGLESGTGEITFSTPQPLGTCGLYITFQQGFSAATNWTVTIPNTESADYVTNKNNYDLAVATRDQVLSQYAANLGQNGSSAADTAKAAVDSAEGAYQSAVGAYQNDVIIAPADGTVSFIDDNLKVGQSVTQNETVISINTK
jgi:multidrug resistance efflux pump